MGMSMISLKLCLNRSRGYMVRDWLKKDKKRVEAILNKGNQIPQFSNYRHEEDPKQTRQSPQSLSNDDCTNRVLSNQLVWTICRVFCVNWPPNLSLGNSSRAKARITREVCQIHAPNWLRWSSVFVCFSESGRVLFTYIPDRTKKKWVRILLQSMLEKGLVVSQ